MPLSSSSINREEEPHIIEVYECQMCAKQFKQEKSLLNHLNVMHSIGENTKQKKSFNCSYCDRKYSKKSFLDDHMSYHGQNNNEI